MTHKLKSSFYFISKLTLLLKGVKTKIAISFSLLLFQGLTTGVGLMLIIPLLAVIGVSNTETSNNVLISNIQSLFGNSGLSLNLISVLIIYLSIMIVSAMLKYFQAMTTAKINQNVMVYWRTRIFKIIAHGTWSSVNSIKSSDLQDLLTLEIRKFGSISNQLIQFVGGIILILVYLIISAFLSLKFTLLSLFPILLIALLNKPINRKTYTLGKSTIGLNKKLQSIILEHLSAIKLVKSYLKEKQHVKEFSQVNKKMEQKIIAFTSNSQKTKLIFEIIAAFIIAVYIYLAIEVLQVEVTQILLLIFIFARLIPKASAIINNFQQILNQLPAMEFAFTLMKSIQPEAEGLKTDLNQNNISLKKEIEFKKVNFSYGSTKVHEDLSFIIKANKINVIIGSSGKGKSTIIDLLIGFLKVDSGEIVIDGENINEMDQKEWISSIAYVPQDPILFHKSISENLLWAKSNATNLEIDESLKKASAKRFVTSLPEGLETIVGNRGSNLSGGERQRIALARALIKQPQILILDEATNAVDDESEKLIGEALTKLKGKITIIIVAHRSNLVELADEIIAL